MSLSDFIKTVTTGTKDLVRSDWAHFSRVVYDGLLAKCNGDLSKVTDTLVEDVSGGLFATASHYHRFNRYRTVVNLALLKHFGTGASCVVVEELTGLIEKLQSFEDDIAAQDVCVRPDRYNQFWLEVCEAVAVNASIKPTCLTDRTYSRRLARTDITKSEPSPAGADSSVSGVDGGASGRPVHVAAAHVDFATLRSQYNVQIKTKLFGTFISQNTVQAFMRKLEAPRCYNTKPGSLN
jgi:hypothetical protein